MRLENLAESIILQSIEDLWNNEHKQDSLVFFKGRDFHTCAELAGMSMVEQVKLLNLIKEVIKQNDRDLPPSKQLFVQRGKRRSRHMSESVVSLR